MMTKQTLSDFLDSQDFFELMQEYRHTQIDAACAFEAVKTAVLAIALPVKPTAQPVQTWQAALQLAHPKSDPLYWPENLQTKYMAAEIEAHRAAITARGLTQ